MPRRTQVTTLLALTIGIASSASADVVHIDDDSDAIGRSLLPRGTVNAVLGDESFLALRGSLPDVETNEDLRLATHLEYVEQQLRAVDTSAWSEERRDARDVMLDHLHDYWTAGVFPHNEAYDQERRPCFIDPDGRICAVGYLIEVTAGRDVSEAINERWQYEYLLEMDMPEIDAWIDSSGLTAVECAMIQPCYGPYPSHDWRTYTQDFGNGAPIDYLNAHVIQFNVLNNSEPWGVNLVSGIRLSLDLTHARSDDLLIWVRSPDVYDIDLEFCIPMNAESPAHEVLFMLDNDAPLGGEESMLDGIYEWRDEPRRTIEQGAFAADGGVIQPGRYSSYYGALDSFSHDRIYDEHGDLTELGAYAPGTWELYIIDKNNNLSDGILRSASLSVRYMVAPTPGAIPLLGMMLLTGCRRRR